MAQVSGIHHVALTVRNRDESAAWYATRLGFEELFREDGVDRKACVMRFSGGSHSVGLVEHAPAPQDPFDPRRRGLDHVAFTVASRDELEQWATNLTTAGVEHSGVIDVPAGATVNLKDPDGIAFALFRDRN